MGESVVLELTFELIYVDREEDGDRLCQPLTVIYSD